MGDHDLLTEANVNAALGSVSVPGRCQVIERKRRWIVDVAHNADAARVLAITLREMEVEGGMTCIIGVLNDKDIPGRLLDYLRSRFNFGKYDSLIAGGRYHNSKDLFLMELQAAEKWAYLQQAVLLIIFHVLLSRLLRFF